MKKRTAQKWLMVVVCLVAGTLLARGTGRTALHKAALAGNTTEVRRLLDQGANIHCRDIAGGTPLTLAAAWGRYGVAKLLLDRGANVNVTMNKGKTPLHSAGNDPRMVKLLLEHGAGTDKKAEISAFVTDGQGNFEGVASEGTFTPLEYAEHSGWSEVASLIRSAKRERAQKAERANMERIQQAERANKERVAADKQRAVERVGKMSLEELVAEQSLDNEGFVLALSEALFEADLKKLPEYLLKPDADPMRLRVEVKKRLAMSGIKKDEYYDKAQSLREDGKKGESVKWSNLANAIKAYQGALMSVKAELESY